ncbi:2-hydroxyacyl-CoA dehydratase subunit D [Microbacterium sp. A82]
MDRDTAFSVFHHVVEARWDAAAITELTGGVDEPIAGFLDTGFPEEIAIAAGYRPMLLTGDLAVAPATVDAHLDVSAPTRIRYLYEALATGRHDAVEVLCVTGGDRWIGETAGFFEAYRSVFGAPDIAHTLYLERARGSFAEHREYNRAGMVLLAEQLSAIGPRAVTADSLQNAIRLVNRTRELLRRVEAIRASDNSTITGVDAAAIALAAMLMPKQRFNGLLEETLDALDEREPVGGLAGAPRVFLSGSSVDQLGFVRLIEDLGAVVVGEDTEFGMRYAHTPVRENSDPFDALADRWTYKFPESWAFGRERRIAQRVEMAAATQPDAVIALHLRGDSAYGWDFPDQAEALRARGIAVLALPDTDYALEETAHLHAVIGDLLSGLDPRRDDTTEEKR